MPVAVVGPINLELGEYELEEPEGRLFERSRAKDTCCEYADLQEFLRWCASVCAIQQPSVQGAGRLEHFTL